MAEKVTIGNATLYCGDCMDILPTLPKVDAVITDPPYGICADENPVRGSQLHEQLGWDRDRPPPEVFELILSAAPHTIIWGGNYFADLLPPTMRWLVWDKQQGNLSLSDCEFAWTSEQKAARIFRYSRGAALQDGKEHPTQKPIALMKWCIDMLPKANSVLDCFLGSGTTGVAAVQMGRTFIGIERERKYFDIACSRIERAQAQGQMFPPEPVKQVQETFL